MLEALTFTCDWQRRRRQELQGFGIDNYHECLVHNFGYLMKKNGGEDVSKIFCIAAEHLFLENLKVIDRNIFISIKSENIICRIQSAFTFQHLSRRRLSNALLNMC